MISTLPLLPSEAHRFDGVVEVDGDYPCYALGLTALSVLKPFIDEP